MTKNFQFQITKLMVKKLKNTQLNTLNNQIKKKNLFIFLQIKYFN